MARGGARRTARRRTKRKIKKLESDTSDEDYELEEQQDSSAEEDEAQATMAGKQQESIRMPEEQSIATRKETPLQRSEKRPRHGGDDNLKAGILDDERRKKTKETVDDVVNAGPSMQDSNGEKEKGKEKIVEEDEDGKASGVVAEVEEVCGICLVEEGKADRGTLDCCDHFFCYTCIMEWAKVESRCPMCKQRFIKIVRPATTATGRSRTVRIPLRNQVYIPSEEEISQYEDPYASVVCMECHEAGDERFLLLCDSCDAAAHTYCVGLGRSVPRGDWFCRSCQASVPQSSPDDEEDLVLGFSSDDEDSLIRAIVATPTPVQRAARQTTTRHTRTSSSRTIPRRRGVRRRLWRRLRHNRNTATSSFIFSQCMRSTVREASETIYNSQSQTSTQPSSTARTVPDQRRLQERIQFIRENWEEIRRGARQFPSGGYNTSPSPLIAPSSKEKTSTSSEPQSKSGDSSCTLEDSSRNAAELARGFQAREVTGCKKEDLAHAWDTLEQAKTLGEGSSFTGALRGTGKHLCSFDRQEEIWSNQNARYSSKTSIAPKENMGVRSHLSTGRLKVNNVSQSSLEPFKLGGNSGAGETSHSKLNEGYQNHRKEGTAVSSSKQSENIEALDILSGRKKDIQSSCSTQDTLYFKCLEDHNHANSQVIDKDNVDAGWSRLESPEATRSSDFRPELPCSLPSSGAPLEVPKIYLDHHSSAMRPNSIVTEVKNMNGKELPASHEGFGLGNANVCSDSQNIVCKSLVDVADSKTTSAIGSNGTNHEEWRTDCKVASASASKCDNVQIADKTTKVEVVKNHVANLVKAELWPIYITKGLGKEQFKEIARSATHALLAVCGLKHRKSDFPQVQVLPCCHRELQTQSIVANYCDSCFKVQVQAVVRTVANNHEF